MSYAKQNFKPGDVLLASQLNAMDDQIALNEAASKDFITSAGEYAAAAAASAAAAETSAEAAEAAASAASNSADAASDSEVAANNSATAAALSAQGAYASAAAADASETAAATSAQNAADSATAAETSAQNAAASQGAAAASASDANGYKTQAAGSSNNASRYAQQAEEAKTAANTYKKAAQSARDAAVTAKDAAVTAQGISETARDEAFASQRDASVYATTARTHRTAAETAANNASDYADAASNSATAASGSATAAADSASAAAQSAQTAQNVAASIPSDYTQLSDDVTELKSAFNNAMDGISEHGAEISGDIITFDKTRKTISQIAISDTSATSSTITRCGINICPKYSAGSANGLSWEVASDGTITFTGTPSADTMLRMYNQNIPFKNGEKKTLAFFNNKADTNNKLSFFMVTSAGNSQVNMNTINKVAVTTHLANAPCTELRLRIPANFDATGLIIKPMIVIGEVDIQQFEEYNGQMFSVTVDAGVVQDGYITYLDGVNTMWSSVGDITVTYDQIGNIKGYVDEQLAASLFHSFYKYVQRTYSSGTQKYLYVFFKSGNKVVRWVLTNTPSSNSNSDTWQIGGVKGYDFDGTDVSNEVELAMNGEFELAIKEHGAEDYCGGINHGDEKTDVFKLFIDGKQISDLTALDENYHAFERIDAFEIATINRCNTPSENIITHQKIWTFENGKVRVHQTCKFLEQIQVDVMMICMFKAVRSVYPYGIRQGGVGIETMTDATFTKKYTTGNDAYYLYYGDNATAKIHAKTDNDGSVRQSMLWIDNGSSFNKLYFGYWGYNVSANPVTVPANTIVTEETEYDVAYD